MTLPSYDNLPAGTVDQVLWLSRMVECQERLIALLEERHALATARMVTLERLVKKP
jgi:hypothetical protein